MLIFKVIGVTCMLLCGAYTTCAWLELARIAAIDALDIVLIVAYYLFVVAMITWILVGCPSIQ